MDMHCIICIHGFSALGLRLQDALVSAICDKPAAPLSKPVVVQISSGAAGYCSVYGMHTLRIDSVFSLQLSTQWW
jgi:hypothetical protein